MPAAPRRAPTRRSRNRPTRTIPACRISQNSPGHRVFVNASYSKQYFGLGATTVSAFWEARTNLVNFATNASYVFAGDMNGDGVEQQRSDLHPA